MLTRLLHKIVADPRVYDLVQWSVGATAVRRRIARETARAARSLSTGSITLDIGGGTGAVADHLAAAGRYVCLDIDWQKLDGFRRRNPAGIGIQADAACIPLADASVDLVLCNSVTHHLPEGVLQQMIAEAARVLKPTGTFILTDAVWKPTRWPGRLLWHYDRGSFPRPATYLKDALTAHLDVKQWHHFRVWHEYVIAVSVPSPSGTRGRAG